MATKLNYKVQVPVEHKKDEKKDDSIKNKTKLSMQSTVSAALASKLPSAPAQVQQPMGAGWGRSN